MTTEPEATPDHGEDDPDAIDPIELEALLVDLGLADEVPQPVVARSYQRRV